MVIWLGLLLVAVIIAVFVWNYRRQIAAREAASAERMKAFLEQARATGAANPSAAAQTATSTAPAALPGVAPAQGAKLPLPLVSGFKARAQLLSNDQWALYALLKRGLPEHDVFAQVSLAAFIQPAENLTGFAREAQERRLTDAVVDFLVCDSAMKAIAAVQCGARSGKGAETAAFAAACVLSTGMRWVEISPPALPRLEAVKAQVLGI